MLVHPGPLDYDWMTRFGRSIKGWHEIGWMRTWLLTQELLRDPYSHTSSALRGDKYIPGAAEVAGHRIILALQQLAKGKNQVVTPPPTPWEGAGGAAPGEQSLTQDERDEHRRELLSLTGAAVS